jgi:hypothetical protein
MPVAAVPMLVVVTLACRRRRTGDGPRPKVARRGIVWVLDSPIGHLHMLHNANELVKILQEPTRIFHSVPDVLSALPPNFNPTALVVGSGRIPNVMTLLGGAPFDEIPILIIGDADVLRKSHLLAPNVHVWRGGDVTEALERFNCEVLGTRT